MIVSHEVTITEMERAFKTLETAPEPPAPLPSATIGQVEAPQTIKAQSLRYRYTSNRASNFGSHFRNTSTGIAWVYVKGIVEGFQMADGTTYNLSFAWEKEDSQYHVSMYVNGRFDRTETYVMQRGQFKLMSITDASMNTEHTHLNLYEDSISSIAKSMINRFANRLHAQAETVTIVTPEIALVEKPVQEITFKVGQAVQWISKRGISSETYVISEIVELASTWYKLQHPYMSNIKITAKAEHIVAYQLEPKKAVA